MTKQESLIALGIILLFLSVFAYSVYLSTTEKNSMSVAAQKNKEKEDKELEELQQKIDLLRPKSVLND